MKCFMTNQDCPFEGPIQERLAKKKRTTFFVVSPFGYPYDDIYANIIQPAADAANIVLERADRAFQLGFVMCQKICKLIQEADYIVADVTEDNPNVFYELGLAWGFGKKILLLRDTTTLANQKFKEIFGVLEKKVLSYEDLFAMEDAPDKEKGSRLLEFLARKHIDANARNGMDEKRAQAAYVASKSICCCYRENLPDAKFYERHIRSVASEVNPNEPWTVKTTYLGAGLLTSPLPDEFVSSKVCLIDVTHYTEAPDPLIYFTLGLAHSLGRETIPITNEAKSCGGSPFDVRGLWQIYFKDLMTLKKELTGILKVIDGTYKNERTDYPLRFIWDKVLKRPAHLSVLTCARGASADRNRRGGRTNVDKWDYRSVADLAFFLAHMYKQAEMSIVAPEEKENRALRTTKGKKQVAARTRNEIQNTPNSVIIIGSPDVSDFAEIVLAEAYRISPYVSQPCKRPDPRKQRRCWTCHEFPDCISQRGYLFYKETIAPGATEHARELSAFFRKPPEGVGDCVVWFGNQYKCEHNQKGRSAEGKTYGALTIFRNRGGLFGADEAENKWIILLSGFTGVATYGLARLLTWLTVTPTDGNEKDGKSEDGKALQQLLTEGQIDLEQHGAQVLLMVRYESKSNAQDRDSREPTATRILDVRKLFPH